MQHTPERMEALVDRRQLFVRELAAHQSDPDNITMVAAPLSPGRPTSDAEQIGIKPDPQAAGKVSPIVLMIMHSMLIRPRTMKSEIDQHIQDRIDGIGERAMSERRRQEHRAVMRRDGNARAFASPRGVDSTTDAM